MIPLRPRTWLAVCILTAASLLLLALRTAPIGSGLTGLAVIWAAAIPAFVYLQRVGCDTSPFLAYAGTYYIVFFGLPVFMAPLTFHSGNQTIVYLRAVVGDLSPAAVGLVAAGVVSMFGGAFFSRDWLFAKFRRFHLGQSPSARQLTLLYLMLAIAGLIHRLVPAVNNFPSIGQFLDPAGLLGLGGLILQWLRGELTRYEIAATVIALALAVYVRVYFLFLTDILSALVFVGFIFLRCGRIKILTTLAAVGVVLVVTYNVITVGRQSTGGTFADKIRGSAHEIGQMLVEAETTRPTGSGLWSGSDPVITYNRRFSNLVHRIGQIWIFQLVFDRTPDPVPYLGGETYRPLLTAVIPRLIYPDKPQERAGNMFGHRYHLLDPDNETSVNIPWITELLTNFGPLSVVLGMGVFGVLLGLLDKFFNQPDMGDMEFIIGLTMIYRLGYQESNFSEMTGSLPLLFLSLYVYFTVGPKFLERMLRTSQS